MCKMSCKGDRLDELRRKAVEHRRPARAHKYRVTSLRSFRCVSRPRASGSAPKLRPTINARSRISFSSLFTMPSNKLGNEFWGQFYRIDNENYTEEKLREEVALLGRLGVQTQLIQGDTTITVAIRRVPRGRRARDRREGKRESWLRYQCCCIGYVAGGAYGLSTCMLLCVLCVKS